MCNRCNSNNYSCGCCNQNSLWNILFGNTQRVCRDCCGNLVVTNNSSCCSCNSCNGGCGCNGFSSGNTANTANGSGNGGFACVSYCQSIGGASPYTGNGCNGGSTFGNGNGCNNGSTFGNRCGCNAYTAWTQENYGE